MHGWPFLVARGRRRGYSVLLTPAFLHGAHGLLEDVVGPLPAAEPVRVAAVRHGLAVAWAEHAVTADDLADGTRPLDEHSRPLRLLYGFACQEGTPAQPDGADLRWSLVAALDTYRRFLADEQRFTVESSAPFELRTALASRPAAPPTTPGRRGYAVPFTLAGVAVAVVVGIALASIGHDNPPQHRKEAPPHCPTTTSTTIVTTQPRTC